MNFLYQAHSGLRYLVLLAGIVALIVLMYAVLTRKPIGASKGLFAAFTGLLDLQVLLGIVLVIGGIRYGALIGHIAMMIAAVADIHISGVLAKKSDDVRRAALIRLMGVISALLLIVFGIMAIGRGVMETLPATISN